MNKRVFKLAVSGLMLTLELPVMSQGTNEYLQPCDITLPKFEVVYPTGNHHWPAGRAGWDARFFPTATGQNHQHIGG